MTYFRSKLISYLNTESPYMYIKSNTQSMLLFLIAFLSALQSVLTINSITSMKRRIFYSIETISSNFNLNEWNCLLLLHVCRSYKENRCSLYVINMSQIPSCQRNINSDLIKWKRKPKPLFMCAITNMMYFYEIRMDSFSFANSHFEIWLLLTLIFDRTRINK